MIAYLIFQISFICIDNAFASVVISESFEGYNVGNFESNPAKGIVTIKGSPEEITVSEQSSSEGANSILINANPDSQSIVSLGWSFPEINPVLGIHFSFDVLASASDALLVQLCGEGKKPGPSLQLNRFGNINAATPDGAKKIREYSSDVWYRITIRVDDFSMKKYDLRLTDLDKNIIIHEEKDIPFRYSDITGINSIRFANSSAGNGKQYLDNVILTTSYEEVSEEINIALNKPYTFSHEPNRERTNDDDDLIQLTDGQYSPESMFYQKSTVAWQGNAWHKELLTITVDLGEIQSIGGAAFNTAAGVSWVEWPRGILIFTSDDNEDYYYAGNLVDLAKAFPSNNEYTVYNYKANGLKAKGRYVKFLIIPGGVMVFVDEIAVFRGPDSNLSLPRGERVEDYYQFSDHVLINSGIRRRILRDINEIKKEILDSALSAEKKSQLMNELLLLDQTNDEAMYVIDENFKDTMPLNALHEQVLQLGAKLRILEGWPELIAWKNNRWDMLSHRQLPSVNENSVPQLSVYMMKNEFRSEAFNITNNSPELIKAKLRIENLPGGINPGYIKIHQVEFVDTREGIVIADALPLTFYTEDYYEIDIPSGMTRQVWLTFNPIEIEAGLYSGKISLEAATVNSFLPLTFKLYPFELPSDPALSLGVWDYTDTFEGRGDIKEHLKEQAIENMQTHFVNSPWLWAWSVPWPSELIVTEDKVEMVIDYSKFDSWVAEWEHAKNFMVFVSVGDYFRDAKDFYGTTEISINHPDFGRVVAFWAKSWAEHIKEMGFEPSQFNLLLSDEPVEEVKELRILNWANAIKSGAPEFTIFENPVRVDPREGIQGMYWACDVLSPQPHFYYDGGDTTIAFYEELRLAGKDLWFYQCTGGRVYDPFYYHRLQAWIAWKHKAVGIGYWSYTDGGATSPWNEYIARNRKSYTPVYFDDKEIIDGKHWEAVREGVEDYEYLKMLRDRISKLEESGFKGPELERAKILLEESPDNVIGVYDKNILRWDVPKEREKPDKERCLILKALEELYRVNID